jgi:hypothetical protein
MDSIRQVEEIIGYEKSTFSVDINGYHLIVLSTEIRNDLGTKNGGILKTQYVSNQNIEWLKNDLKENTLPCLIFTHYGLAENDMKDNYWFYINSELGLLKNRDIIKNIIKNDKNILAVFSGHLHTNGKFEEDGVTYYHVGSLTYNTEENGIPKYKVEELKDVKNIKEHPDGIYFEVNLNGRNMEIIEHHIDLNKI